MAYFFFSLGSVDCVSFCAEQVCVGTDRELEDMIMLLGPRDTAGSLVELAETSGVSVERIRGVLIITSSLPEDSPKHGTY